MSSSPSTSKLRPWPRLLNEELAADYLSISRTSLRTRGPKPKHVGRRALWDIQDLDRWVDALSGQPLNHQQREDEGDDILRRVKEKLTRGRN